MRVVFDTNIFIAAALKGGFAEDIIEMAATTELITPLTSEEILHELSEKLTSKFHWTAKQAQFFQDRVREIAEVVEVTEKISVITRDPEDNKILECAVAGNVDLIVSADQDLIKLKKFRTIAIVHPKTLAWTFPQHFKKTRK